MTFLGGLSIVIGLILFEVISSIDNAVINADVLLTMSEKARRWFLRYGIFIAVVVIRGLLPLLIVYVSTPHISMSEAFVATFSSDERVKNSIEESKPVLLAGGGMYLVFLFFYWLFLEKKEYAFFLERHIHKNFNLWFYSVVSLLLLWFVWSTIGVTPFVALGAVIGSTAFFITNGFKENAEKAEKSLVKSHMSDVSKLLYLELIDTTFSIDGVLGAFAFTISVPLILLGNGIGALLVRYVTVHGAATVKKYRFLKNGAMYSVGVLGVVMLMESFGNHIAEWVPPLITVLIIGTFFWLSAKELRAQKILKI